MDIALLLLTYNRLHFTKLALESILKDPTEKFKLYIWDNNSTDGTQEFLKNEVTDTRIEDIILKKENRGQVEAINTIWSEAKADLVGKLDNDIIMSPGWTKKFAQAHADIPNLGAICCWHFSKDDFDYQRAKHKIVEINNHKLMRNVTICGAGFLIKKESFLKVGRMEGNVTTPYWLRLERHGFMNGFYYPLILMDHMDDYKSPHYKFKNNYHEKLKTSYSYMGSSFEEYLKRRQSIIDNLLESSPDIKNYIGWRFFLKKIKNKLKKLILNP